MSLFLFQVLPRNQTITSIQWVGDHQVIAIGTDRGDVRLVDGQESRLVCMSSLCLLFDRLINDLLLTE